MEKLNGMHKYLLGTRIITADCLSEASLSIQVDSFFEKLVLNLIHSLATEGAHDYLSMIIGLLRLKSVAHTNAFQIIIPGSSQTTIISNYYPLYDNSSFEKVG